MHRRCSPWCPRPPPPSATLCSSQGCSRHRPCRCRPCSPQPRVLPPGSSTHTLRPTSSPPTRTGLPSAPPPRPTAGRLLPRTPALLPARPSARRRASQREALVSASVLCRPVPVLRAPVLVLVLVPRGRSLPRPAHKFAAWAAAGWWPLSAHCACTLDAPTTPTPLPWPLRYVFNRSCGSSYFMGEREGCPASGLVSGPCAAARGWCCGLVPVADHRKLRSRLRAAPLPPSPHPPAFSHFASLPLDSPFPAVPRPSPRASLGSPSLFKADCPGRPSLCGQCFLAPGWRVPTAFAECVLCLASAPDESDHELPALANARAPMQLADRKGAPCHSADLRGLRGPGRLSPSRCCNRPVAANAGREKRLALPQRAIDREGQTPELHHLSEQRSQGAPAQTSGGQLWKRTRPRARPEGC